MGPCPAEVELARLLELLGLPESIIDKLLRCLGDLGLMAIRLIGDIGGDWMDGGDLDLKLPLLLFPT